MLKVYYTSVDCNPLTPLLRFVLDLLYNLLLDNCAAYIASCGLSAVAELLVATRCCYVAVSSLASTPPGMPGTHPPIFWLRGCQREYPPQYYYVLSGIADQYWLPSVRSASSRFHSAIRRHQFASVRQADDRLTRFVPPTLNSR